MINSARLRGAQALRDQTTGMAGLLGNATSLLATTVVTSILGFLFWGFAARLFSASSVGAGSAAVSAMTLLGTFGMFGVGTVLIGQLSRVRAGAVGTISAALLLVGGGSTALGVIGALALPAASASLAPFASGVGGVLLFASGVATTSVGFVLDQALIGLLRGGLQLWRNSVFAAAKLALLIVASLLVTDPHGIAIYATWMLGNAVSFVVLLVTVSARGTRLIERPNWAAIRDLRGPVFVHNWLNGAMQAPRLLLPVLVVAVISPAANAAFYAAYLVASFLYMVPTHLSTVLYAVGAGDLSRLRAQARLSLTVSAVLGAIGCVVLAGTAPLILGLFGSAYAARASTSLRVLALGVFPTIVLVHFVAVCRISGRIARGGMLMTIGGAFELGAAGLGSQVDGLTGLSVALVLSMCCVAAFALSDVRLVTSYRGPSPVP